MAHLSRNKDKLLSRVRRITGQLAAIERAIEADAECSDVLQQVAGVRGAVNGLMEKLIEEHLLEHVVRSGLSSEARSKGAEELLQAIQRYSK